MILKTGVLASQNQVENVIQVLGFNYGTRIINGRGLYSKIIFLANGRGLCLREASI